MINKLKQILKTSDDMWFDNKYDGYDVAEYIVVELKNYIKKYENTLPNLLKETEDHLKDSYVGTFDALDYLKTSIENLIKERD